MRLIDAQMPDNNTIFGSGIYLDWNSQCIPIDISPVSIFPGNGVAYVEYQVANYEWPLVINRPRCVYAIEIYALDKKSGALLWEKPAGSKITSADANNSSIFYGTRDGKVFPGQGKAG